MEQAPKPMETKPAKGRKTWPIVAGVVIIIVIVVAGLYFGGYLVPPPSTGKTISIFENPVGSNCLTSTECGYNPSPTNVTVGTKVTWKNNGNQPHTATACNSTHSPSSSQCPTMNTSGLPDFDVPGGGNLNAGNSGTFTFNTQGTYYYYCRVHSAMHGTIYVNP